MPADAFRGIGPAQYDNAIITPPVPREQSARTNPGGYGRRFSVVASTPAIGWVWQDSSRAAKVIGVGIVRKWNHSSAANRTLALKIKDLVYGGLLTLLMAVGLVDGPSLDRSTRRQRGTSEDGRIGVDAAKIGEPISKYVYGQFIEHLGRCIYGGIWAEMLEDRKFFYPVDAKESPWKAIDGATVTMVREKAFVGQHTPAHCACRRPAARHRPGRAGAGPGQDL